MNYIDLINSFWDSATTNPLSTGQVSLYFALLHVCNRSYWTEWFAAPNQVLSVLTGLSRSGILKARNELKQRGLIDFRERGTKATYYKLTMLNSNQESAQESIQTSVHIANSVQDSTQNSMQDGVQDGTQDSVQNGSTLYKTKDKRQDKDKNKDIPPISPVQCFEDFWCCYPLDKNRYLAEQAYIGVVSDGIYTENDLVESAKNYAEAMRIRQTPDQYIKSADNFLKDMVFGDYLPGKYKKPASQKLKNSFNNFKQECDSDVDELENHLLANK